MITTDEYGNFIHDSAFYPHAHERDVHELNYLMLGLGGEAGEAIDAWKKIIRDGEVGKWMGDNPLERNSLKENNLKLVDEVGDVMWYMMHLLQFFDLEIEDIMLLNAYKLYRRHRHRPDMEWPFKMPEEEAEKRVQEIKRQFALAGGGTS